MHQVKPRAALSLLFFVLFAISFALPAGAADPTSTTVAITDVKPGSPGTTPPAGEAKLFGSPYVTDVTPTSATVNWVLRVGPVAAGEAPTALATTVWGWRVEHAALTNLKPSTTYYYDVLGNGTSEGRGQFTTAPNGSSEFTFEVYGDTRTRHDVHRQVAEKMAQQAADFVIHTGDLVADGRKSEQWPIFFEGSQPVLRKSAFFPAIGNHDRNSKFFYDLFRPGRAYYSFDWGRAHFAILNSDVANAAVSEAARESYWEEQLAWLERDLAAAAAADFRVVVLHHPPYSAIESRQPAAEALARRLTPLFRQYKVQVVFSGHDHNYQRHVVYGVQYVVTGGGGAPLYELNAPLRGLTQAFAKTENFVVARVNSRECLLQAFTPDGRLLDAVSILGGPAKAESAATVSGSAQQKR